jgi:hypothetical protein
MNLFTCIRNFDNLDHKAIAQWLGENNPDILLQAANGTRQTGLPAGSPGWIANLKNVYKYGDNGSVYNHNGPYVVAAIKYVRENTGLCLKDAKDVIDCLRDGSKSTGDLSYEAFTVFNQIVNASVTRL